MARFDYLFPKITNKVFKDIIKKEEDFIKDLNRDQMYDEGVMNVEHPTKLKYAKSTIAQKKKKARYKKTSFITLRWMGEFYDSLKVLIFENYFIISSDSTIWARFLEPQDRFGKALGLTEKSKGRLKEVLKDDMIRWLRMRK